MRVALYSSVGSVAEGGGATYVVALASALSQSCDLDLFVRAGVNRDEIDRFLPGANGRLRLKADPTSTTWVVGEARSALFNLSYDIVIVQSTRVPRGTLNRRAYVLCEFPFQREVPWDDRVRLDRYAHVVANSAYTARWIERLWGRTAKVLYPAVVPIVPRPKRPYILGAGRFLAGGRSKRQVDMVEMFRQLLRGGLSGWELHLAGFAQDASYVEQVKAASVGLPVTLHLAADRAALEELYGVSSIFWHATGAGADSEREPGRMEHFGIVTAEAMSAGCVPVVFNGGGQPEIVAHESGGVLWDTFDECVDATWRLTQDDERRGALARRGVERAALFAPAAFGQRVRDIFSIA